MRFTKHLKGVFTARNKHTAGFYPAALPLPSEVRIPVKQHSGPPAKPVVAPGDRVFVGQLIAESFGKTSAPVHSSVSGVVRKIMDFPILDGTNTAHIVIDTDGKQEPFPGLKPPVYEGREAFLLAVEKSGIVGLGGAGFPMAAKYDIAPGNVDTFIVNGAESEPYITSDHMTMMLYPKEIIKGTHIVMRELEIPRAVIAVQVDKPDAVTRFKETLKEEDIDDIELKELPALYPEGEEHSIVFSCTGRRFPAGARPDKAKVLVSNVCSVLKLWQFLSDGMPLVSRAVTFDGDAIVHPQNVEVPVGTKVRDIIEGCGGASGEIGKVIIGGPLTGIAVPSLDYAITKRDHAVLCFGKLASAPLEETACIRCDRCVKACPMDLVPFEIADAWDAKDLKAVKSLRADRCMGCNACSFVCPARRMLGYRITAAKEAVLNE